MAIESKNLNTHEIRREISHTRDELGENLGALEDRIKENWARAKQKIDPVYQTRKHPWIAVGASVAVGALATTAVIAASRRNGEASDYSQDSPSSGGKTWELGKRVASTVFEKFSEEVELAKSLALAAGLKKTGEFVKRSFPQASEAVDRVLASALSKLDGEDYAGRAPQISEDDERRSGEWAFKVSQTRVGKTDFSPYDDGAPT